VDDRDLQLLRQFRIDEAEPPAGLQSRIEEQLWQAILAEEAAAAGRAPRRGWRASLVRPLAAMGAAAALALGVAVVSDGGSGVSAPTGSVTRAGGSTVFDSTATALFGGGPTDAAAAPIDGSIDLTDDDLGDAFTDGPVHDQLGQLDERSGELASSLSRDPAELRDYVRDRIAQLGVDDRDDHAAYRSAMRWVVDPAVPVDLRAALLRSLAGLRNIDEARMGMDVLGRAGVVLGHLDSETGVRTQAVLQPDGGSLLEVRSFTTTYVDPACEPGTFTEHVTFDEDGRAVDPSSMPWIDWPAVVAACGAITG
jgi:hypothetical protein